MSKGQSFIVWGEGRGGDEGFEDHMVFRENGRADKSSPTEYERGTMKS